MTRSFDRSLLPPASRYYREHNLRLRGMSAWQSALCPFHDDTRPSLRVQRGTGAFRCMVCGARGSGVLAFHMQRYSLSFLDAARQLGAIEVCR